MLLAPLTQSNLPPVEANLRIGEASLIVRGLWLREGLGLPYVCNLVVLTHDMDLRPQRLINEDATLEFGRVGYDGRCVHGIVQRIVEHGLRDDVREFHVTIGPALALLQHRVNTRVFMHQSVVDILRTVLGALEIFGRPRPDFSKLYNRYEPRDLCVQYAESDLDFAHRLMGEEGICYRFVPNEDDTCEQLVLCDAPSTYYVEHRMLRIGHGDADEELLGAVDHDYQAHRPAICVSGYNWRIPDARDIGMDNESQEKFAIFVHDGRRQVTDLSDNSPYVPSGQTQSDRRAELLGQRARYETTTWALRGNVTSVEPGSLIEVSAPEDEIRDGLRLCITESQHVANFPHVERHATERSTYECTGRGTLVAFVRDYGVPRPRISGPQTATVVGPEGEEIWVDEHGRIKVRFHWEQTTSLEGEDGWWVPVKQMWGGQGWGTLFIPRIGMEVVVEFLDGNPDCPLVTGCVYNGANPTPYQLPDMKTISTIKSRTSPGGDGFNELRFEDAKGSEEVFLHAQKKLTEVVKAGRSSSVGGSRSASVGSNDSTTVGGKQTLTVDKDRTKTVMGAETNAVADKRETTLGADDLTKTTGKTTQTLLGGLEVNVTNNAKHIVSSKHELLVTGEHVVHVTGKSSLTVTETHDASATTRYAMTQGGVSKVVLEGGAMCAWGNAKSEISAGAGDTPPAVISCSADGKIVIKAATEISLQVADTTLILSADGTLSLCGPQKVTMMGGGASSIDLSAGGAEVSAPTIKSAANGAHEITGAQIKLN